MIYANRGCTWNCHPTHHPKCQYYRAEERAAHFNNASPAEQARMLDEAREASLRRNA